MTKNSSSTYQLLCVMLCNTVLFIMFVSVMLGVIRKNINLHPSSEHAISPLDLPAYAGLDHLELTGFLNEQSLSSKFDYRPYYSYKSAPFAGKHVNIDENGFRRVVKSFTVNKNAKRVFIFGGSTTFGVGAPDEYTMPSIVQEKMGRGYDIYNMGEQAFVSTQGLNLLMESLSKGNIPDVVVFYDGINDTYTGVYSPNVPRDPHNERVHRAREKYAREYRVKHYSRRIYEMLNFDVIEMFVKYKFLSADEQDNTWDKDLVLKNNLSKASEGVVNSYEDNIRQVKSLAKEYKFEAYFFWQPSLFYKENSKLSFYEKKIMELQSKILRERFKICYQLAKDRFSNREHENIYFLGNIFDSISSDDIYVDRSHLFLQGNKIIANAITDVLLNNIGNYK